VRRVTLGLGRLLTELPPGLAGAKVGLVANAASRLPDGRHAAEILAVARDLRLVRLFGPEHGFAASAGEGERVADGRDPGTDLEVVSLYGLRRAPEAKHLNDLDALLFDLQDVGVRAYTYLATLKACLLRCAELGKQLVVLDRPNPLGRGAYGPGLEPGYASFVGAHPVRFVHGMTLGELACVLARDLGLTHTLLVVTMRGYEGGAWTQTGLPWWPPSPNLPALASARLYSMTVFLEGTNLSEGRGTARPFEQFGAPWLDSEALAAALDAADLGVRAEPTAFTPTRAKFAGQRVRGVRLRVAADGAFDPVWAAFSLLRAVRRHPHFAWVPAAEDPVRPFIDLLFGASALRRAVDEGDEGLLREALEAGAAQAAKRVWLYGRAGDL
jgi:uncharacterized protein YbbC (DUF1343 family)